VLFIRSLCSLLTTVYAAADSVVDQVTLLPSNNGLRHSEQYLLYVRSLCSLSTLIVCTVVSQVALLPSYNNKATVSSLCSLPVPIYSNLSQFIWIYSEFICIFHWRERMLTNACKALAKHWLSRHHSHVLLAYIYDKVFIWASGPVWTLY